MSFPKNVGQVPIYYAAKNTGRPLHEGRWFEKFRSNYLDVDNAPLYPFGYGLSYTTFEYSPVVLSTAEVAKGGSLTAEVTVKNTGAVAGKEVVQMYIQDVVGSTTRPVRELKGFEKISLEPGESKVVKFEITPELMSHYNSDLEFVAEPGEFVVSVGTDSRTKNSASFILK
jgi:beta-glucosidase